MDTTVSNVDNTDNIPEEHLVRLQKLADCMELARVNLARAATTQSRYYNLRHRATRFHVGNLVMRKDHVLSSTAKGFAAKLAPRYSGPYRVEKCISNQTYALKEVHGHRQCHSHIKDLKPAYSNP
ncbi:hypothetical protein CBL_02907 [Carabus blaptoides fortunei]